MSNEYTQWSVQELKRELTNHGVALPKVPVSKEEYQQIYIDRVLSQRGKSPAKGGRNGAGDTGFSSDEEFESPSETVYRNGADGAGEAESGPKLQPTDSLIQTVDEMTNEEIYSALVDLEQIVGPVVKSTREMYKKKLIDVQTRHGGEIDLAQLRANTNGKNRRDSPGKTFSSDEEMETSDIPTPTGAQAKTGVQDKFNYKELRPTLAFSSPAANQEYSFLSTATFGSPAPSLTSFIDEEVEEPRPRRELPSPAAAASEPKSGPKKKSILRRSLEFTFGTTIYGQLFWGLFWLFAAVLCAGQFWKWYNESKEQYTWENEVDQQIDDILRSLPADENNI